MEFKREHYIKMLLHFHTIQRSALYNIRCSLTLYSVRLNRINSAREPNKHGSRTELTVYN